MGTIKDFFLYIQTKKGNQLSDKNTVSFNNTFGLIFIRISHVISSLRHHPSP